MTAPAPESLQVTLLGRGVGECVVVHLPGGDWLVVDGFNHRGQAAALHHLGTLNVSPDEVAAIVITHFHTDHYGKVEELHDRCSRAKLYITEALACHRFQAFFHDPTEPSVFGTLPGTAQRANDRRFAEPGAKGLVCLKSNTLVENRRRNHCVLALSPSDFAVTQSNTDLADLIGKSIDPTSVRLRLRDDNRCSIVLYIDVGFTKVLLGADLEAHPPDAGWAAVRAAHGHLTPAGLLKVPHHGSETSDHAGLWELTEAGAELVVSPYWSSGLPRLADVQRLAARGRLWQTVPSTREKTALIAGERISKRPLGWVTATRGPEDSAWDVTHGGTAFQAAAYSTPA